MEIIETFDVDKIDRYTEQQLVDIIKILNKEYHGNSTSLVSDEVFDFIVEYARSKYPGNISFTTIGHTPDKKFVKLPFHMGSMDKIKNDEQMLQKWIKKNNAKRVLISDKLDGVSALLIKKGDGFKLYTRGDGTNGQDISHIYIHLRNTKNFKSGHYIVRGELILTKNAFSNLIESNVIKPSANSRNTVSGIVNAKRPNVQVLNKITFVGYEVLGLDIKTPSEQMIQLQNFNITPVYSVKEQYITTSHLQIILQNRKLESSFEIDGIVVINDIPYTSNKSGNPSYAFAFKMDFDEAEVCVKDVIWNMSKDGLLIPTVLFDSVMLNNVMVKKATGFNAKYIEDNKINIGSKLLVTRSGEVVPYIKQVLSKSNIAKMPESEYVWNESRVHIIGTSDKCLKQKLFEHMIVTLDMKGINSKLAQRLYDNGIDTLQTFFDLKVDDLLKIDGIQQKSAMNIIRTIADAKADLSLEKLMVASNCFGRGFGPTLANQLTSKFPYFVTNPPTVLDCMELNGIDKKTATQITDNIPRFKLFLVENNLIGVKPKCTRYKVTSTNELSGFFIVCSGNRDQDLIKSIQHRNGIIEHGITKKTTHLITTTTSGTKYEKASKMGLEIINPTEFKQKYNII